MSSFTHNCYRLLLSLVLLALSLQGCGSDPPANSSGAGPKLLGEHCSKTEDCASALCVRLDDAGGICSQTCADDSGCPRSDNWGCVSAAPQSFSVCACVPLADQEVCGDHLDNDCNGQVDDCRICDGKAVANDDHEHCGSCDSACRADQRCESGTCGCVDSLPSACGDVCVDTKNDPANCGKCGDACGPDQRCAGGECTCSNQGSYCDGEGCFDLQTNADHCGACGNVCTDGQQCSAGKCVCPAGGPQDFCPGVGCVDRQTSSKYCGACDNACPAAQSCVAGACSCPNGRELCDDSCVDTETDHENCGECGNACATGLACLAGVCGCTGAGLLVCGDACVYPQTDEANCGECGNACAAGEECRLGDCACTSGLYCDDVCVPVNDDANCGQCGVACPSGQSCAQGACRCDGYGLTACGDECVNLNDDEQNCNTCDASCRNTETCNSGSCECAYGSTYCAASGACVPLGSDEQNCGTCGKQCNPTEACTSGSCGCPVYGQLYCAASGACIDTLSDEQHCGGCTTKCRPTEVCSSGTCACSGYSELYCTTAKACVDVYTDNEHCGACDQACPAGTHCAYGGCQCDTAGQSLCGSTCYDLQTNADHCGSCDNDCGGNYICAGGACTCPAPVVGTAVRVTNDIGNDWGPVAVWNGTNVGVAYMRATIAPYADLRFAVLKPNGTVVSDTAVTAYTAERQGGRFSPAVAWNGSEFAIAWTYFTNGYQTMFQRFNASGVSKGAAVSITGGATDSMYAPGLAWSPSYGGYAAAYGRDYNNAKLAFRRIGATGAAPEAENLVEAQPAFESVQEIVVAPDGSWGVSAYGYLAVFNADGSRTQPLVPFSKPGSLVHDGANWLMTYPYGGSIFANRGVTSSVFELIAGGLSANYIDNSSVMVGGTLAVLTQFRAGNVVGDSSLMLHRYSLPATAASKVFKRLHQPISVLATNNFPDTDNEARNFSLVATGPSSLLAVWADNRWGASKEIYAAPIDLKACP